MVSDHLALLVGRIILTWGQLDQNLYSHISMLQKRAGDAAPIDTRFAKRKKHLRRLISLSDQNAPLLPRLDSVYHRLRILERNRAHVAHGACWGGDGEIKIHDAREIWDFNNALSAIEGPVKFPDYERLHKEHVDIVYSANELTRIAENIEEETENIVSIFALAAQSDRWR